MSTRTSPTRAWALRTTTTERAKALAATTKDVRAEASTSKSSTPDRLYLYGGIGGFLGIWAEDVVAALRDCQADELEVHVNSPGGDVFDGIAIRNLLVQHDAKVTVVVDGLAASIASVIALAGDEVVMATGATMMIHEAWGVCLGPSADMHKMGDELDAASANIARLYSKKAGGTPEDWREAMVAETWYSDGQAVAAGLADRTLDTSDAGADTDAQDDASAAAAAWDLSMYAHTPPVLAAAAAARAGRSSSPGASAPGSGPAASSASGDTYQEEDELMNKSQLIALCQALGVADDADGDTIVAAAKEALAERAEPAAAGEGTVVLDQEQYTALKTAAEAGQRAEDRQLADHRDKVVADAVTSGRIPKARAEHWRAQLDADPGVEDVIRGLEPVVNLTETGHAGSMEELDSDDALMAQVGWGSTPKEERA